MSDLTAFLLARIAEDEAVARASVDEGRPGMRWHWVTTVTDVPVAPGEEEEAMEYQPVSLRTVEEFPTSSGVGDLPGFLIHTVDEAVGGALRHITRHDPARVLAECEAKRWIVEQYESDRTIALAPVDTNQIVAHRARVEAQECVAKILATVYADHPDYREEWRP